VGFEPGTSFQPPMWSVGQIPLSALFIPFSANFAPKEIKSAYCGIWTRDLFPSANVVCGSNPTVGAFYRF